MQGRIRVSTREGAGQNRSVLFLAFAALIAFLSFSCSNSEEPLIWGDSSRDGLGVVLDTIEVSDIFVADTSYLHPVVTGNSVYFLAGQVDRPEPTGNVIAKSYLRWDVSELPAGDVVTAHLSILLRGLDQADTATSSDFKFEMREVAFRDSIWNESNLGVTYFPEEGRLLDTEIFDVSAVSDTSDLVFPESFIDVDLGELVEAWAADASTNLGVVIQPDPNSEPRGLLRFISREGLPILASGDDTSSRVALTVVVDPGGGDDDTTMVFETVADGYIISAENDDPIQAAFTTTDDTDLLLSSGYVRRIALNPDIRGLIDGDSIRFPLGTTVHQADLKLFLVEGEENWVLADEEELSIGIYYADSLWSEGEALPSWSPIGVNTATITNETDPVELSISSVVQSIFEGSNRSFQIRCATETGYFKSVLFHGRLGPLDKRPRLRIVISQPGGGRMEPWPEG